MEMEVKWAYQWELKTPSQALLGRVHYGFILLQKPMEQLIHTALFSYMFLPLDCQLKAAKLGTLYLNRLFSQNFYTDKHFEIKQCAFKNSF